MVAESAPPKVCPTQHMDRRDHDTGVARFRDEIAAHSGNDDEAVGHTHLLKRGKHPSVTQCQERVCNEEHSNGAQAQRGHRPVEPCDVV